MAVQPPDSDATSSGSVSSPELAISAPPGPPSDTSLVASPIDGSQPQGTPIKPPRPNSYLPSGLPVKRALDVSPTTAESPQTTTAQSRPPKEPEKLMEDGCPVAAESPTDHPQPPGTPPQVQFSSWSSGLYDCHSDMDTCCLVFWCPCIAFGRMAEIVDEGKSCCNTEELSIIIKQLVGIKAHCNSLLHALSITAFVLGAPITFHFILSYKYRGKLKRSLNFPPSSPNDRSCRQDLCTHFWCEPCALSQEYRQLQAHGYDLSLGWHGNLDKQRKARLIASTVVSPPTSPTMRR